MQNDDSSSDESENEEENVIVDSLEYNKFLNSLFPSKHMKNKINKMKKNIKNKKIKKRKYLRIKIKKNHIFNLLIKEKEKIILNLYLQYYQML